MSVPSKSVDKKRFNATKTNEFVTKTRPNERTRPAGSNAGWTNLGKISARRIPPPANVPSLKNEIGTSNSSIDPIVPSSGTNHGWTVSTNQNSTTNTTNSSLTSKQPTQQQIDAQPANSSTSTTLNSSSNVNEQDKLRTSNTWSNVTAGNNHDQAPNFGLKDFPRLTTQDTNSNKNSSDNSNLTTSSSTTTAAATTTITTTTTTGTTINNQGPVLRPANLASWKEGGGRIQPVSSDTNKDSSENNHLSSSLSIQSPVLSNPTNSTLQSSNNTSSYNRIYPNQQQTSNSSWNYNVVNSHGSNQSSRHQTRASSFVNHSNQSQSTRSQHGPTNEYKTATILKNKDIDDLSKLNDNVTWASASEEVNYEERIRFSDDEDNETVEKNSTRHFQSQVNSRSSQQQSTRSRLIQDDDHLRQLQEKKNSEMINTLNVAKQRRDEQERHLRPKNDEQISSSNANSSRFFDENQLICNYQTARPLLTSTKKDVIFSSSQIDSNRNHFRTRQDPNESQKFTMKSWSDQMESLNHPSSHDKSTMENDEQNQEKFHRSQSESSSQSQIEQDISTNRSKQFSSTTNKQTADLSDYFQTNLQVKSSSTNSNDQWNEWEGKTTSSMEFSSSFQNDSRRLPSKSPEDLGIVSESNFETHRTKTTNKHRTINVPRPVENSTTKSTNNKAQSVWRALSPTRQTSSNDPTPQESISYKTQTKTNENSANSTNDRRQTTTIDRKTRYSSLNTPINTASIPPLMSVRSDVPPPTSNVNSKHFKTNNNLHYSQRNDFYNENNDSAWGNEDEYYDDDNGYYEGVGNNHSRHHSSMVYHSHHRGYTALGSYGRYRRGGTSRHQQYSTYSSTNPATTQLNTSFNSKSKKTTNQRTTTPKKESEQNESTITILTETTIEQQTIKKPSAWSKEPSITTREEIPITKLVETPTTITTTVKHEIDSNKEKTIVSNEVKPLLEIDIEANLTATQNQHKSEPSPVNGKKNSTINEQKRTNQDQRQANSRHRTTYERSTQDYDPTAVTGHTYYGNNRRGTRGHEISNSYYYGHSQQRYNNQYNYSQDAYLQTRATNKPSRRGNSSRGNGRQPTKSATSTGSNSNTKTTHRHHSASDVEQKEGEEWETASESSTNMRHVHSENSQSAPLPTTKAANVEDNSSNRDRTPPKKSFSNQRPSNNRYGENSSTHRRGHTLHERGSKTTRSLTHRSTRISSNFKSNSPQKNENETKISNTTKKEAIRHSLDGYDLNNVAGVVKIETLPAGALEEEGNAFDDGGDEFCLVMSKRDRKEQKAAQLSKQNAIESNQQNSSTNVESSNKIQTGQTNITENDEQTTTTEKSSIDGNNSKSRNGKGLPPRFNGKSTNSNPRQHNKSDHQNASYYYDQNSYYYYNQNQYYDQDSYYNYGNYNNSHRQSSSRRKTRQSQTAENPTNDENSTEKKHENNVSEKSNVLPANVMSHIDMWNPHTENTLTNNSKKPIEKPTHERKFNNEIAPPSNETSLVLPQRSTSELTRNSPSSKTNENIVRTIKPPGNDGKTDRDEKKKPTNFTEGDNITSLSERPLFEKTFLDYDDKPNMNAPTDDYNQKINSLKMIWDSSEQPGAQLEQTINSMVAMQQQQQQESSVSTTTNVKNDSYVKETITVTNTTISGQSSNMSTGTNDETTKKTITSTVTPTNLNPSTIYASNSAPNKNEPKNVCTVKPTQQVPPNIQDQADVSNYSPFPVAAIPTTLSQAQLPPPQQQAQQHILSPAPINPVHQPHSYQFYDSMIPAIAQQQQQQTQQQFSRYPQHNFPYRGQNVFMQPQPPMQNTNPMYHHQSQGSMTGTPQASGLSLQQAMPNFPGAYIMDPVPHMMGQPQAPPPPAPYMNNPMIPGRTQPGHYYRTPPQPQPQLPTPPGPGYGAQDTLQHGGFYPPFLTPTNANPPPPPPPVTHNIYGPGENFHPASQAMFSRGGSIDRADHSLMPQQFGRHGNYHSTSSNQAAQQTAQQGAPMPLLPTSSKQFTNTGQPNSSTNQAQFYQTSAPPHSQANQYNRQHVGIGQITSNNTRQPAQPPQSLMGNYTKNPGNNGNNGPSFPQRPALIHPQSNNNRSMYHQASYPYPKSTGPNDDNMKPKHI